MHRFLKVALVVYIVYWTVGLGLKILGVEPPFGAFADFLFIFLAATVVFALEAKGVGLRRATLLFLWIALVSAAVETVGTLTGYPFGEYYYTANFGPTFGGVLPLAIPLAWWIVMMPIWRLLRFTLPRSAGSVVAVVLTACAAVAVDFIIEPMAVVVKEYWVWPADGFYFGVPLTNFMGWWITALALAAVLPRWGGEIREVKTVRVYSALLISVLVFFAVTLAAAGVVAFILPISLAIGMCVAIGWTVFRRVSEADNQV